MNPRDDTERVLERFAADWPADGSVVGRVMQEIESRPVRKKGVSRLQALTMAQRIAAAGVALSTVVGLLLLFFVFANSARQLSAMERVAEQLRAVKSFSYKLSRTLTSKPEAVHHPLIIQRNDSTVWRAPGPPQTEMLGSLDDLLGSLYAEMKIVRIKDAGTDAEKTKMTVHVAEISPSGKPGILVNHLAKTYFRTPPARVAGVPDDSPIRMLQIVREEASEVVRKLGTKEIAGKRAIGYLVEFTSYAPFRTLDSVEVWIDPETDLPLAFSYQAENKWKTEIFRVTDCQWNIDLDPKLFAPTPPEGYIDITPPTEEEAFVQIADALRLYAELSGGHYPRASNFDGDDVRDEMLKMAGFTGPAKPEWERQEKYLAIQQATAGLKWITRILFNKYNAGYDGSNVGPQDADKVLLWWGTVDETDNYRVFYGDLRTEVVSETLWKQLVPRNGEE